MKRVVYIALSLVIGFVIGWGTYTLLNGGFGSTFLGGTKQSDSSFPFSNDVHNLSPVSVDTAKKVIDSRTGKSADELLQQPAGTESQHGGLRAVAVNLGNGCYILFVRNTDTGERWMECRPLTCHSCGFGYPFTYEDCECLDAH